MQFFRVLLGCLAAYLSGVVIVIPMLIMRDYDFFAGANVILHFVPLIIILIYSLVFSIPVVFLVILGWLLLAWRRKTVPAWAVLAFGAALSPYEYKLLSSSYTNDPMTLIVLAALGVLSAAVFWVTAFGFKRSVLFTFRSTPNPPEPD